MIEVRFKAWNPATGKIYEGSTKANHPNEVAELLTSYGLKIEKLWIPRPETNRKKAVILAYLTIMIPSSVLIFVFWKQILLTIGIILGLVLIIVIYGMISD